MSLLDDFNGPSETMVDDSHLLDSITLNLHNEGINNNAPTALPHDDEPPMFDLSKVEYKPNGLNLMVVSSNSLVMGLSNCHIIRINLQAAEEIEDIEISRRPDDRIHRIFLDPTGCHLLISMATEDNYYIHSSWKKPKLMPKLKGILVESMSWDIFKQNSPTNVSVMLGTSKGRIYVASIEATEQRFMELLGSAIDLAIKQVYNLNERMPITGLRVERFPPSPSEPTKYFVIATTPTRIYQFIGGPNFESLFSNYEVNPGFQELPGDITHSDLVFFSKHQGFLPQAFAWLTGPGIYHGGLTYGSQNPGDTVITDSELLHYVKKDPKGMPLAPLSISMTEFHFLLLYDDRFQVISKLNSSVVYQYDFNPRAVKLKGVAHDHMNGNIFLYAENVVFEVYVKNEDRDVWKLYLEKRQFAEALEYCKDPGKKEKQDKVWTAQADYYFNENKFDLAATYYGKTQRLFEEITLKFININERDALKTYLVHKLQNLRSKDLTQRTIICTWLTEIYANKLNQLKDTKKEIYIDIVEEFHHFLANNKEHLNQATTFHLLSSHGCIEELLYYATLIEDYERVISHHIQHGEYKKALTVLGKLGVNHEILYYQFSPVLMLNAPYDTVNCWFKANFLNPRKLIPALMRYDPANNPKGESTNQAIRYLQHCVGVLKNTDPAIHNYLISLYAKQSDTTPLLQFLQSADSHYDQRYALRLCTKEGKLQACVLIYSAMGLYEEAVDLALKVDLELAKVNADKPEDDDSLRKKLWLRIARHVVSERRDVKEAVAFLAHTDLLQIEDILPFFPDFVLIDDFKEEICKSLEDYNRHIDELKAEMDEATHSAELIHQDIKELRNKYGYVGANQRCDICQYQVLTKQFYLFPCQHVFHADCLSSEILPLLSGPARVRVRELQNKIANSVKEAPRQPSTGPSATEEISMQNSTTPQERLKKELDEYIASECPLCGDIMIRSIDKPFIAIEEVEAKRSWAI
eukprot:TRINITY_DN6960_c0_g1_i1.p1 TRINITY_DN6960_c0_g1~~TRINITY_DN6960_c0_g1_i1.p1  ORF type:complete len:978 (+),score=224.54 TRINITY_DN6960_c0_g1_i1:223-3156(+)